MPIDAHKNFAYSTVATAPSPATSGTSLVVAAGQGALFPAVPFNATIWPTGANPISTNAEVVRVTAIATDTLTIVRAQEGSTARSVVVGDQIAANITAKTLTDVEALIFTTQTDTAYTLVLADANTGIKMSSSTARNLTVPPNSSVAFPIGTQVVVEQAGTAAVTIVPGSGVTLEGVTLVTAGQYSVIVLVKQATDTWLVVTGNTPATQTIPLYAVCSGDSITSTTLVNIAGMSLALTSGTWIFEINISGSAATGTAGAQFGVEYSGTKTSINAEQIGQLATTTWAATARITAFNTASTIVMTTSAAQCYVRIFGQVVVTGAGNLTAKGLKVTSQTLTINAASWMMAYKVA